MPLPKYLVDTPWPHPHRQRRAGGNRGIFRFAEQAHSGNSTRLIRGRHDAQQRPRGDDTNLI
jgi:hypothetical protein